MNDNKLEAIKKCYRVLCEEGIFITFENFVSNSRLEKKLYLKHWKAYQVLQRKSIVECDEHINRYVKNYFPITVSEYLDILSQCGANSAEIMWVSNM